MTSERRMYPLEAANAEGWFERLRGGMTNFEALVGSLGEKFVAFSFIAGVRITGLTPDPNAPDATLVDFVIGDAGAEQRMALGEFRRRLALALLSEEAPTEPLPDGELNIEQLQGILGFRYGRLAPLFGMHLRELKMGGGEPPAVVLETSGAADEVSIEEFQETLRDRIRSEVRRARSGSPFAIDLAVIPEAAAAAEAGNAPRVIDLLGAWPGPLSLLLRTPEGHQLASDVRANLAKALSLLGTAYRETGKNEWAEEVVRLGVQWAQDAPIAAELFAQLGRSYMASSRPGEAIGVLRRALALGLSNRRVLPDLARCYSQRRRFVAAAVCAEDAIASGAEPEAMYDLLRDAIEQLGPAWGVFRRAVPLADGGSPTIPAPPMPDQGSQP